MAKNQDTKYYKTPIHGLEVHVGAPGEGEVAPKTERFVPYYVMEKGKEGKQRYGYLATDNGSAIKKLHNDYNVVEISEDEYKEATDVTEDDAGNQLTGFRAPY